MTAEQRRKYDFAKYDFGAAGSFGFCHSAEFNFEYRDPDEIFREFFGGKDPFEAFFGNKDPFEAFFADSGNTCFLIDTQK